MSRGIKGLQNGLDISIKRYIVATSNPSSGFCQAGEWGRLDPAAPAAELVVLIGPYLETSVVGAAA